MMKTLIFFLFCFIVLPTKNLSAETTATHRVEIIAGGVGFLPQFDSKTDVPSDFLGCSLSVMMNIPESSMAVGLETVVVSPFSRRLTSAFADIPSNVPDLKPKISVINDLTWLVHGVFKIQTEPQWYQFFGDVFGGIGSIPNLYSFARNGEKYNLPSSFAVNSRTVSGSFGLGGGVRVLMPRITNKSLERWEHDRQYFLQLRCTYQILPSNEFIIRQSVNYDGQIPIYQTKTTYVRALGVHLSAVFIL